MRQIDADKLEEHLDLCIDLAEAKNETKIAEVLRNLKKEVETGQFDTEK